MKRARWIGLTGYINKMKPVPVYQLELTARLCDAVLSFLSRFQFQRIINSRKADQREFYRRVRKRLALIASYTLVD